MSPPPYWKGYLKLSLVSCPVARRGFFPTLKTDYDRLCDELGGLADIGFSIPHPQGDAGWLLSGDPMMNTGMMAIATRCRA
jgi:hypothetical protein